MVVAASGVRPREAALREVVEALAAIERPPCSEGERRAAEGGAERRRAAGGGQREAARREVVEALAAIERPPCSEGERRAAEWVAERLRAAGAEQVAIEEETGYGTFPPNLLAIGAIAAAGAVLALRGRRAAA